MVQRSERCYFSLSGGFYSLMNIVTFLFFIPAYLTSPSTRKNIKIKVHKEHKLLPTLGGQIILIIQLIKTGTFFKIKS